MGSLVRLCQSYSLFILLVAAILSPPPYLFLALVLFLGMTVLTLRPAAPRINIVASIFTIFLLPLAIAAILARMTGLTPFVIEIISAAALLPLIYLLDYHLRQSSSDFHAVIVVGAGRRVTTVYRALLTTTLAVVMIAVLLDIRVLLLTGTLFALYLMGTTINILMNIPRSPLAPTDVSLRVVAGATAKATMELGSRTNTLLYVSVQTDDDWVEITPQDFILNGHDVKLELSLTPPLAGPTHPLIRAVVTDARALMVVNQTLEPLDLHVIPQAQYAEWMARKYLEQSGAGEATDSESAPENIRLPHRGVEFLGSRTYQAGDPLRGIDWKHTIKLQQLIVREFAAAGGPPAIIAVNLSVSSAEEADNLAFNLLTAALTLTREHIPAALTAYNQHEVLLTTAITEPREILKRALALTRDITMTESPQQYLAKPDMARLRRNISELKRVESESAQRLLAMLDFEHRAIEEAALNHPATVALTTATRQVAAPAVILLVSQLNHDAEAILVNSEKLARRKYAVVPVNSEA
ncbi:MAG: DUF58 domain-containing protein [Dehalococcoidales bacterium]|nr:DUF58 domain-containing protein [Dehalococcoidales bacterium]